MKCIDCTFLAASPVEKEITRLAVICKDHPATSHLLNGKIENQLSSNDSGAEDEIILSEQKLRSVLNNSIGAIFLLDKFYRIIQG